jgi:hypothetical protein
MQKFVVILLISLSFVSTAWARGAYKWIDDNGVVHYSDRMRGDQASIINIPVREPEPSPAAEEPRAAEKSGTTSAAETEVQAAAREKKIRQENCLKARNQLEVNQQMTRMYRVVDGERQYLSEKQRSDVIKRSREAVSYWCQ